MAMVPCSGCGALLEPARVLYNAAAQPICEKCLNAAQVREGHAKSAATARSAAYGNIAVGVASFFFNPFLLLSIGAVGNAVYVFKRIKDDVQRGEKLPDAAWRKIAAVAGAVLGVVALAARFM